MSARYKSLSILLLISFCAVANWSHAAAMIDLRKAQSNVQKVLLPAPNSLKLISLGYDSLVADLLWLQFIQYLGGAGKSSTETSGSAAAMLDEITTLDPHFVQAYFFIATIVGGEQNDPLRADTLLQRGINANPDNWYIPFMAGVNEYLYSHDENRAAKYYRIAANFPSAPDWLKRQADILEANIPSAIKHINIWRKILETGHESSIKEKARQELVALWVHVRDFAPSASVIRKRAEAELEGLGVTIFHETRDKSK